MTSTPLQEGWAFAKKGDGYLALYAAQGLERVERGQNAYRELRSYGSRTSGCARWARGAGWDVREFKEKVLAAEVAVDLDALRSSTQPSAARRSRSGGRAR